MIKFLQPEKFVEQLNLRNDLVGADFGCGSGGFTIPLAKKLSEGFVYALDIQKGNLAVLERNAKIEGIRNIKTVPCDLEEPNGSGLGDLSVDFVIIANTLFQVQYKEAVLREASRILVKQGKLIIIDWKIDSPFGPENGRISQGEIEKMARKLGFKLEKEIEAGTYHFALIFKKI